MSGKIRALIITSGEAFVGRANVDDPNLLTRVFGGPFAIIAPTTPLRLVFPPWHAYRGQDVDGEGWNMLAFILATGAGWNPRGQGAGILRGPVVFFGDGPDGGEADVPDELIEFGVRCGLWQLPWEESAASMRRFVRVAKEDAPMSSRPWARDWA